MKLLIIFIVSFAVLSAYAGPDETSPQPPVNLTTLGVPSCGQNEVYKMCKCPLSDLCVSRFPHKPCSLHIPGCRCCNGYLRQRPGAPCRPMKECPRVKE